MPRAGARGCVPGTSPTGIRSTLNVSMPRAGARGCVPSTPVPTRPCARLNAPCWGAGVCATLAVLADTVYADVSMPRAGARGCVPRRTSSPPCLSSQCPVLGRGGVCHPRHGPLRPLRRVSMPRAGARGCVPGRTILNAVESVSQCPVLGRGGVCLCEVNEERLLNKSQCPVLGRGGVCLYDALLNPKAAALSQCPVLGRGGVCLVDTAQHSKTPIDTSQCPVLGRGGVCPGGGERCHRDRGQVSMPRAGARGCVPVAAEGLCREDANVSMPRAGARGCVPPRPWRRSPRGAPCLNAPCWGAGVCAKSVL